MFLLFKFIHLKAIILKAIAKMTIQKPINFFYNIIGPLTFLPHTVSMDNQKRKYTAAFVFIKTSRTDKLMN